MEDFEKNRIEYVQKLETKFAHIQAENEKHKDLADKWEPKITVKADVENDAAVIGLQFNGKYVHITLKNAWLAQQDETSATSAVIDAFVKNLVADQLKTVVAPEVERLIKGAQGISGAGKW